MCSKERHPVGRLRQFKLHGLPHVSSCQFYLHNMFCFKNNDMSRELLERLIYIYIPHGSFAALDLVTRIDATVETEVSLRE